MEYKTVSYAAEEVLDAFSYGHMVDVRFRFTCTQQEIIVMLGVSHH